MRAVCASCLAIVFIWLKVTRLLEVFYLIIFIDLFSFCVFLFLIQFHLSNHFIFCLIQIALKLFFHQNNSFKQCLFLYEPNSKTFVNEVYFYNIRIISFMDESKSKKKQQQQKQTEHASKKEKTHTYTHTKHKENVGRLICYFFPSFHSFIYNVKNH